MKILGFVLNTINLDLHTVEVSDSKYDTPPYNLPNIAETKKILHGIPIESNKCREQPRILWNSDHSYFCLLWPRNGFYSIYRVSLDGEVSIKMISNGLCSGFAWSIYPKEYALLPKASGKNNKIEFHVYYHIIFRK